MIILTYKTVYIKVTFHVGYMVFSLSLFKFDDFNHPVMHRHCTKVHRMISLINFSSNLIIID